MFLQSVAVLATVINIAFSNPLSVKIRDDSNTPGPVQLVGFDKCSTDQTNAINQAWDEAMEIASAVKVQGGNIESDILGSNDQGFLTDVGTVIGNAAKWTRDINSKLLINARCDDPQRPAIDPPTDCPPGTARADYPKCKGHCWTYNEITKKFVPNARAYTLNDPPTGGPTYIAFCPSFFDMQTCEAQVTRWGNSPKETEKLNLVNYRCQGHVALHELIHVQINYQGVNTPGAKLSKDREIQFTMSGSGIITLKAYDPQNVRLLANYGGSNANFYVLTNADSLAIYSLAKWVNSKIGAYPLYPVITRAAINVDPFHDELSAVPSNDAMPFAVISQNNQMVASSLDNLALAYNTSTDDALADYAPDTNECADPADNCSDNPPVSLVPNQNAPTASDDFAAPTTPPPPPAATDCTTVTTLTWEVPSSDPLASNSGNPDSQQWDTMTFKVSGKFTGASSPATQVVWADQDTSAATPKLGSAPGPLPAFLVETYDHDRDWVQYDYGSKSWDSGKPQCKDSGWDNGPKASDGRPQRVITCTFDC